MNFGRAQRWPAGRRIRRERTDCKPGGGFAQSRIVETLRAAPPTVAGSCKRLTRYACTPFLSTAKEREERMPPLNPPSSRHAGAADAKIHKLAFGFGQYEFWPRPTLACRAADKAGTHYPADCNISAFSFVPFCSPSRPFLHTAMPAAEPAPCEAMARMMAALVETLRAASPAMAQTAVPAMAYALAALRLYSLSFNSKRKRGKNAAAESAFFPSCWRVGR